MKAKLKTIANRYAQRKGEPSPSVTDSTIRGCYNGIHVWVDHTRYGWSAKVLTDRAYVSNFDKLESIIDHLDKHLTLKKSRRAKK